jgi:hypothetical protein
LITVDKRRPLAGCHLENKHILQLIKSKIRVSDPDPHGSALIWAVGSGSAYKLRIRIRIQEGKNDPKK